MASASLLRVLLLHGALFLALSFPVHAELVDVPQFGVRLAHGFRIMESANQQFANAVWCMALNPRGKIVVSGAGCIRTLLDTEGAGHTDKTSEFAKIKGATGLCLDESGRQLLIMADCWLSATTIPFKAGEFAHLHAELRTLKSN